MMEVSFDEFLLYDTGRPTGREFTRTLWLADSVVTIGPSWSQEVKTAVTSIWIGLIEEKVKAL